jgi:hypothetical protein
MRTLPVLVLASICAAGFTGPAQGGPNAGGVLVFALMEGGIYSPDIDYCDGATAGGCDDAVVEVDPYDGSIVVIHCLALFVQHNRLSGITFGVDYDDVSIVIEDAGACGHFELPDSDWPDPGSGTAVTWGAAQTDPLVPIYWFAVSSYYSDDPYELFLTPHPTQGGNFADDDIPANIDPIIDFGTFGFNVPGSTACPQGDGGPEACCFQDCSCVLLPVDECVAADGIPQGPGTVCEPNPCSCPPVGACCFDDCSCMLLPLEDCASAGGVYLGDGSNCDPNPCECTVGACCFPDGFCDLLLEADCIDAGGIYQGNKVPCDPYPCEPTPTIESSWGVIKERHR